MELNFFKKLMGTTAFSLLLIFSLSAPPAAALFDGSKDDACTAVGADSGGKCDDTKLSDSADSLTTTLNNIINVLSIIIGIAAVIMLIVGGFRYITSAGDSNGITSAKHTIAYALVGLVVVALAQVIVKFVLNKVN